MKHQEVINDNKIQYENYKNLQETLNFEREKLELTQRENLNLRKEVDSVRDILSRRENEIIDLRKEKIGERERAEDLMIDFRRRIAESEKLSSYKTEEPKTKPNPHTEKKDYDAKSKARRVELNSLQEEKNSLLVEVEKSRLKNVV
jgi:hypothetical protein